MHISCPICSELMLLSDHWSVTPCGHVFHTDCVNRWLQDKLTCPQCRQECSKLTTHRIYLPEGNFHDHESLLERMNELNRLKIEAEKKAKKEAAEKNRSEQELRRLNKAYHKTLQRKKGEHKLHKNGPSTSSHIPPRHYKSTAENVASGSANSLGNNREVKNPRDRRKKMRNQSRVERAKAYFIRKKADFNSRSVAVDDANNAAEIVINISDDSRSN